MAAAGSPLLAWTPDTTVVIARHAEVLAPPDLTRQIERHRGRLHDGILAAAGGTWTAKSSAGRRQPTLQAAIKTNVRDTIQAIEKHRSFGDIVYRLGILTHHVAQASYPLIAATASQSRPEYFSDYREYLASAHRRFAVVVYGAGRNYEDLNKLQGIVERSLARGRRLSPLVAQDYQRIGTIDGVRLFDDRSTAFGVGSLAFSHAVSDVTAFWRYVWLAAGGIDSRQLPEFDEDHVILLTPGEAPR
jgi:hypothetical protein